MKIKCDLAKLSAAYQHAAAVAPQRSPKPILQNVKFTVGADGATMTATDMEIGIVVNVDGVEVTEPGSVLLPVGRFGAILRESYDETLEITADAKNVVIRGQRSEFKFPSQNADEFPIVARFDAESYLEVPVRLFRELIRRTVFATDPDSPRYALGGVLFEMSGDRIVAVGTDSRRLAKMEGPANGVGGFKGADVMPIVPTHSVKLLERVLGSAEGDVKIAVKGNDFLVQSSAATVSSRLLEGRFPKWRDVLPKNRDSVKVDLSVGPLLAALRQAAIVTTNESRGVDFKFATGTLTLAGRTAEFGQSRIDLPIAYDSDEKLVTLDHRFVADFLQPLDPEKGLTFDMEDSEKSTLFSTDDGYEYVVMPLAQDRG